jgi:hypothetical protein
METAELRVSEYAQLSALKEFLRQAAGDAEIAWSSSEPTTDELGALDWVTVLASSSVLAGVLAAVPRFLATRKPSLSVKIRIRDISIEISGASSVDEFEQILNKVFDG